ncbi:Aldo/keto reductase [Marasmius fiardii PR-910]|nr:Aldo/keto reductase [Marasmius fiardii PR-910]
MSTISHVTLNTGSSVPCIEVILDSKNWFLTAIKAGYRFFDTAQIYSTESSLGAAIKESGIPREEFTISTKPMESSFNESLQDLGVDYVDLYLLHFPQSLESSTELLFGGKVADHPNFNENWSALEKFYESGQAKAIGVSNFSIKTLDALLTTTKVVPAVNQIEMHPYLAQNNLLEYYKSRGIVVQAYTPSAVRSDPTIVALAEKYSVTPTQIILAWHVSRGVIPIPKSENSERQKENITLPMLSPEDIKTITSLVRNERIVNKIPESGILHGWTAEQYGWD